MTIQGTATTQRIRSIDGLRGLVMLLMLVDHAREFFFIGHQVGDPMDIATTTPGLFFTRLAAHLCAPVFVALTGLAAWLYGRGRSAAAVSAFLLKRGLFLIALELTLVGFGWSFAVPPAMIYLQVIWAIGLSMIALAALVHLPRAAVATIGIVIVAGHNLLDPVAFAPGTPAHAAWAILHERAVLPLAEGLRARTSYPVLPWIGVIAIGYAIGPWFAGPAAVRRRRLIAAGVAMLLAFVAIRAANGYGEPVAWTVGATPLATVMSFLNLTKYPPSLDFLLLTLGIGALLLAAWEGRGGPLAVLGGAPLFFYLLHIYALHLLRLIWTQAGGGAGDVPSIAWVWAIAAVCAPPLWLATRWFAGVKRRSDRWWIRYL
ncbi:hypothetical protein ASG29_13345 [Sphingomonas sp. Leaf412]|uniref:DUF1624 domain-containing protein n=1 Tax=Sphingomonas sp. Leaf412 TaxID=1736370 RepID=UPI0006F2D64C|nr:DUF1624 domain-containing protein [Sphingomonas sp. Leaf412]KQT32710.1 hypothetical protein ASG29_13345 [Sphingomonas sp. Leaf412]